MKTKTLRSLVLASVFLLTGSFSIAAGDNKREPSQEAPPATIGTESTGSDAVPYREYVAKLKNIPYAATDFAMKGAVQTVEADSLVTYTVDVQQQGLYYLQLEYRVTSRENLALSLKVDGKIPFEEAAKLEFPGHWVNSSDKRYDGAGNEIAPEQLLYDKPVKAVARDYTGVNELPYALYFTAGNHTVELEILQGAASLQEAAVIAPEQPTAYQVPTSSTQTKGIIVINGEDAILKNNRALIPLSDGSSAAVVPTDPVKGLLNYIGGSNWSSTGDMLQWEFRVDKAGYYSLGVQYRQNIELGAVSYRHLTIDGKTPFEEARRLKFKYSSSWEYFTFGGEEPYLFYLDEGLHTLELTVTSGEMAAAYASLRDITTGMGDLYVDITMVVGETVDVYRSYELFRQIPDFNERLESHIKALDDLAETIERLQEKSSGSMVSTIDQAIETLNQMLSQPYSAHKYISSFYTAYTNLGALMGSITNMPLDVDTLFLIGCDAEKPDVSVSFFKSFAFQLKRFAATFQADYNAVSGSADGSEALTLWVNWGRDQAQVLTALINERFVEECGIHVKVEVVNATLIQGILAGKGPDCMLQMARTEPVNLAMRGALENLMQFDDYEEVIGQFIADGVTPYTYNNGVYALPDTQSFNMLFVRTDILNDMGVSAPTTWEEFSAVATLLQRNNLQVYMPQTLFPTMLLQNGLSLYNEEEGITRLTESEQIRCFISYTDWFTKYKLPKTMDSFFNRFRIGSTPMGISDFTMLTQLETAAPEIDGRWAVLPLPGTLGEDGVVSQLSAGAGTGCAITRLSKSPDNAWRFLKWWISAETQLAYSSNLESIIGPLGRVSTANLEAFAQLGWSRELLPQLLEQQQMVKNLPELPGGYYVTRCIEQAFWNVVEQNANANDTLLKWGAIADKEMRRKKAEYTDS